MTTYLKFTDMQTAIAALGAAGVVVDGADIGHQDIYFAGQGGEIWSQTGWGEDAVVTAIPGVHVNVESALPAGLEAYVVPAPTTPFTVRA